MTGLTNSFVAPAKINLHLRCGPARPDGFHPLLMWMVTVGLHDTFELREPRRAADEFTCSDPGLPMDSKNLVVRAVQLMRETRPIPPLRIHLVKRIPAGGGLGGGSSNAASMLKKLDQLFPVNGTPSVAALAPLAERLGSDVPFFLSGPSSICRGRGEIIEYVAPPRRARWVLLLLPLDVTVATAAAYQKFDELGLGDPNAVESHVDFAAWGELPATQLLDRLVNDLEAPAFALRPALDELREVLERFLQRIVRMSGSGSSLFTLFDDQAESRAAAIKVGRDFANVRALDLSMAGTD